MTLQQSSYVLLFTSVLYSMFVFLNYKVASKATVYGIFMLLMLRLAGFLWYGITTKQPAFIIMIMAEILFGILSTKEVTKYVSSK